MNPLPYSPEDIEIEDVLEGEDVVRLKDGTWLFKADGLQVPGAEDRKLSNELKPQPVGRGEPTKYVLDAREVATRPEVLTWCQEVGYVFAQDGVPQAYMVSAEDWKNFAERALGIDAPQSSDNPYEAELARVERDYRRWEREGDRIGARRLEALRGAVENGVPRARAAAMLRLTPGRITQLLKPPEDDPGSNRPGSQGMAILRLLLELGPRTRVQIASAARADRPTPNVPTKAAQLKKPLARLSEMGAVTQEGDRWLVTPTGRAYVEGRAGSSGEAAESTSIGPDPESPGIVEQVDLSQAECAGRPAGELPSAGAAL